MRALADETAEDRRKVRLRLEADGECYVDDRSVGFEYQFLRPLDPPA
jgi:hypothetical protein